jgi:hypothetical protein
VISLTTQNIGRLFLTSRTDVRLARTFVYLNFLNSTDFGQLFAELRNGGKATLPPVELFLSCAVSGPASLAAALAHSANRGEDSEKAVVSFVKSLNEGSAALAIPSASALQDLRSIAWLSVKETLSPRPVSLSAAKSTFGEASGQREARMQYYLSELSILEMADAFDECVAFRSAWVAMQLFLSALKQKVSQADPEGLAVLERSAKLKGEALPENDLRRVVVYFVQHSSFSSKPESEPLKPQAVDTPSDLVAARDTSTDSAWGNT